MITMTTRARVARLEEANPLAHRTPLSPEERLASALWLHGSDLLAASGDITATRRIAPRAYPYSGVDQVRRAMAKISAALAEYDAARPEPSMHTATAAACLEE